MYDIVQTPDARYFQNIRFISNAVTIVAFSDDHKIYEDMTINDISPRALSFDNSEDNYSASKIFQLQNDEWYNKDCVSLEIKGKYIHYNIEVKKTNNVFEKFRLVAMTMFKDDVKLIPSYVKYYSELGIDHFFMYYNGKDISNLNLPDYSNVTYVQWNYPYRINIQGSDRHCAQIGAINDFLYWGKHLSSYILYNDLDEYIYWNGNKSLLEFIESNNYLCYGLRNIFTALLSKDVEVDANINNYYMIKNKQIESFDIISPFKQRSKCIVSTNIDIMGIHIINKPNQDASMSKTYVFDPSISAFYHIYNFKNRKRVGNLDAKW